MHEEERLALNEAAPALLWILCATNLSSPVPSCTTNKKLASWRYLSIVNLQAPFTFSYGSDPILSNYPPISCCDLKVQSGNLVTLSSCEGCWTGWEWETCEAPELFKLWLPLQSPAQTAQVGFLMIFLSPVASAGFPRHCPQMSSVFNLSPSEPGGPDVSTGGRPAPTQSYG